MAYPTDLDDLGSSNPTGADTLATAPHSSLHSDERNAIDALQEKVGIDGSADTDSLDYKVANKQPLDATLTALAGLATGANKLAYSDGADSFAQTDFTAAARTVLDDASVADMVDTLGGAASTGSGGLVRATSPTLVTPALGTPSALVATNATGTASALVVGTAASLNSIVFKAAAVIDSNTALVAGQISVVDTSGGSVTVTLPSGGNLQDGHIVGLKKIHASNTLTVARAGKNIDGAASDYTITQLNEAILLQYEADSDQWSIIGLYNPSIDKDAVVSGTNTGDQTLPTRASLGLDTTDSPQFTAVNVGHASDTTLARSAAGVLTVEGKEIWAAGRDIALEENTSLALDPAGSADGKYTGITIAGTAGAALAFGDVIVLDVDDSRWELASISAAAAATGDARGMLGMCVLAAASDGDPTKILLNGTIRADANFPALTIGAPVYASTSGDVVVTQPTTTDHVIRILGFALTADEMYFNPSPTYMTHT